MKNQIQFPDVEIVAPLAQQLSWSHFVKFMSIKTKKTRTF